MHELEIAVKDVDEWGNRWTAPFASAVRLAGFRPARGARVLPVDRPRGPRIAFLGDSITQGVRVLGPELGVRGSDATKAYAWLTGQAFGADFHQVGFGGQGITVPGSGEVPIARETLGHNFAGSPIDPDYVPDPVPARRRHRLVRSGRRLEIAGPHISTSDEARRSVSPEAGQSRMRGEHGRVLAAGINHTRRSPRHVIPPTWSTTTRWWSRRAGRVFSDGTLSFRQTRYGGQRSLADLVDAPDLSCRPVRGVLTGRAVHRPATNS